MAAKKRRKRKHHTKRSRTIALKPKERRKRAK